MQTQEALAAMLTAGALREFCANERLTGQPVLQILSTKLLSPAKEGSSGVVRVVLNDGVNWARAVVSGELAMQLDAVRPAGNGQIGDNTKFSRGSVIRATDARSQLAAKGDKKILVLLNFDIISSASWDKLGSPVPLEEPRVGPASDSSTTTAPATTTTTNLDSTGFYGQPNEPASHLPSNPAPAQAPIAERAPAQHQRHNQAQMAAAAQAQGNFMPIAELTPYQNKWKIRATCSRKFDIKTWSKANNNTGKLFSVNLMDQSGEIRATGFNAECDRLYDTFQEGVVYYITSPCNVKSANKQFTTVKHDYEITFERQTVVERADDQTNAPAMQLDFTSIGNLPNVAKDEVVNVVGILKEIGEEAQLTSKATNRPYSKRDLTIVDDSLHSVKLTVWGNVAQNFQAPLESAMVFKGAKVSDFGGRSLSLLSSGSVTVDPDIDEVYRIKGWYDSVGRNDNFSRFTNSGVGPGGQSRGEIYTISRVKEEGLGASEEPQYFSIKASIAFLNKDTFAYPACSSPDCNRKVVQTQDDYWRCEKCNKEFPQPTYRYVLSLNVSDHTGQMYISCFDEIGRLVIGMSADAFTQLKESDDNGFVTAIDEAAFKTYVFRCKAKMETYQDNPRIRYQVMSATPINHSQEGARLGALIQQYEKVTLGENTDDNNGLFVH